MTLLRFLKARMSERSTWAGIVAAVAFGSTLAHPWDYVAIALGAIAVFVPEPKGGE